MRFLLKKKWTLAAILVITPLGFYSKFYTGPGSSWVNNSLGGVLYVIFWVLVFSVIFVRTRPWKIAGIVVLITCMLEFLQLWHPRFLELIRSTFIGATLLGNSFSWLDLAHYLAGSGLAFVLLTGLQKREESGSGLS